jgi:hypothetical protein
MTKVLSNGSFVDSVAGCRDPAGAPIESRSTHPSNASYLSRCFPSQPPGRGPTSAKGGTGRTSTTAFEGGSSVWLRAPNDDEGEWHHYRAIYPRRRAATVTVMTRALSRVTFVISVAGCRSHRPCTFGKPQFAPPPNASYPRRRGPHLRTQTTEQRARRGHPCHRRALRRGARTSVAGHPAARRRGLLGGVGRDRAAGGRSGRQRSAEEDDLAVLDLAHLGATEAAVL